MARVTNNTSGATSTAEAYRAIIVSIEESIAACGLVRTADTGQINPATVTIPTTVNTDVGYSVWRFSDALQSVAPIFIKLMYRRGSNGQSLGAKWTIGTATDGSGNFVGASMESSALSGISQTAATPTYDNYYTHSSGFFGIAHFVGIATGNTSPFTVFVQRTVDNNGAPTAEGVVMTVSGTAATSTGSCYRMTFTSPPSQRSYNSSYSTTIPGDLLDSRINLDPQVFLCWTSLPKVKPLIATAGYLVGEITEKAQFSIALVGVTPRNYIALGPSAGRILNNAAGSNYAMLWED